jgi:Fe2+ or Zn2+ uptake regulation protein
MAHPTPIVDALDRAGYRMTEPRRSLAALIAEQNGHFTAADLVKAAQATRPAIGRATVFRTLDLLEGIGAVERLDLPNGEHAYVGCEPAHHHHVVCSRCGRSCCPRRTARTGRAGSYWPPLAVSWRSTSFRCGPGRSADDHAPAQAVKPFWRTVSR